VEERRALVRQVVLGLVVPLLLLPVFPATAQSGAQCAAITADAERLACYDSVYRTVAGSTEGASVVLESNQLIPARPSGRAPATITVSCTANELQVAFGFAGNTMSSLGRDIGLTLQYDLQRARSSTLPVNADNTAVLIDNTPDALAFIAALEGATNLTVRVTPATTRSLNVRFDVENFDDAVAPVVESCGL
jgi:type VI secretion system protein VasI